MILESIKTEVNELPQILQSYIFDELLLLKENNLQEDSLSIGGISEKVGGRDTHSTNYTFNTLPSCSSDTPTDFLKQ